MTFFHLWGGWRWITFADSEGRHRLYITVFNCDYTSCTISAIIKFFSCRPEVITPVSPSDYLPIFSFLSILPSIPLPLTQISFRCFKSTCVSKFTRDILHSRLITRPPPNLSDLVDAYNSTLTSLIDIHAPLKTKTIRVKPINKWYTPALSALKRHAVTWKTFGFALTHSPHHLKLLRSASNKYHSANIAVNKCFNASFIISSSSNTRKLWNSINTLLERKPTPLLPSIASSQSLSQMFDTFFSDKILKLHTALKSSSTISSPHIPPKNTLTIYSALSLPSLKMKCLKSSLSHLTLSLILIPFLHLSSNNAYLHSYQPWLTS